MGHNGGNMMIYYFRTVKDETLKEVAEPRTGVWAHVVTPSEEELEKLIKDLDA